VTHRYTLLVGGTVLPGPEGRSATAIAWAEGVVLALGTDEQVRAVSRGDSHVVELHGAFVVPADAGDAPSWPRSTTLAVGDPADLDLLADDPRATSSPQRQLARIRGGHVVSGALPTPSGHAAPQD
jgi:hypothetical protein